MPRRKSAAYMSAGEQIAGTVLFVIYLLVLPFVTAPLFRLIGGLLGVPPGTLRRTWAGPASSWPSDWWPCTA